MKHRQQWVDMGQCLSARTGPDTCTVVLTFEFPADRDNFLAELCSGHELRSGGLRHDTGKWCVIHGDQQFVDVPSVTSH